MLNFIIDFAHDNGTKTIIKHIDSENEIKLTEEFLLIIFKNKIFNFPNNIIKVK